MLNCLRNQLNTSWVTKKFRPRKIIRRQSSLESFVKNMGLQWTLKDQLKFRLLGKVCVCVCVLLAGVERLSVGTWTKIQILDIFVLNVVWMCLGMWERVSVGDVRAVGMWRLWVSVRGEDVRVYELWRCVRACKRKVCVGCEGITSCSRRG